MDARETVAHHNRVLGKATDRVRGMEDDLADAVRPILEKAGREAVRRFRRNVTDHLTASAWTTPACLALLAAQEASPASLAASLALRGSGAGVRPNSTMIAVKPRLDEAQALEHDGGTPAADLHVTLCYLGELEGPLDRVVQALRTVAGQHAPLEGVVAGTARFKGGDDGTPGLYLPSVPGLVELRVAVTEALASAGIDFARNYGYVPHMTISYEGDKWMPGLGGLGEPLHFDDLLVVRGDVETHPLPLVGAKPLTAAGEPPAWTPPAGDEIVDVPALVSQLRTKTDPVRQAVVETTMTATLEQHRIAWDATNPFTARVLEQAGSQITNIAATTQLNAMRIIHASYEEGLTIPDTAKALQAGMSAASDVRATLIARTELAGAVNGGSLAATQIADQAMGGGNFQKQWLTASGARFPRHEDYDGLDGQTTTLDGYFSVGGDQLQYPGDPNGSPEEVCNCRCAINYLASGQIVESDDAETAGDVTAQDLADAGV